MEVFFVLNAFGKLVIPQLIYWDATKNKIGKRVGDKGFINMSAGGWATLCLLGLWIIAVPLYVFQRKRLIALAKTNPVDLSRKHRIEIHATLLVIPIILTLLLR